jgi:hypothetical protein
VTATKPKREAGAARVTGAVEGVKVSPAEERAERIARIRARYFGARPAPRKGRKAC